MNILKAKFYEYPAMGLDQARLNEIEAGNSSYVQLTHQLAKEIGVVLIPLLGSYKGRLYPLLLPLNVESPKVLEDFAAIASQNYNSLSVNFYPDISENDLEDCNNKDDLQKFVNAFSPL